jgi:PAS domain S-box-containing protein
MSRDCTIEPGGLIAAVAQAADSIVITDAGGKIQYVNPAFTAMTGYAGEEVVGQNPRILKSGWQSEAFYKELWSTIRSGRPWFGELTNRRKDGTLYVEEMRITPVRDPTGEIVSYVAIKRDVTLRRAADEAQGMLSAIVENSEDAIIAGTTAGFILTWNRGAKAIFGYSSEEAIGQHVSMLIVPGREPELTQLTARIAQGITVSQCEASCRRKDGRDICVSITGSPIRNSAGDVIALSEVLRDISERREAEQARALLAAIVESSDEAIHSVSLDGVVLSWNRGAEVMYGYSCREIIGESGGVLCLPERQEQALEVLAAIRQGRAIPPYATVLQAKDGHRIDVLLSISPTRNPAGELTGASVMARDIGDRLRAERKVKEAKSASAEVLRTHPSACAWSGWTIALSRSIRRCAACWDIPRRNCLRPPGWN